MAEAQIQSASAVDAVRTVAVVGHRSVGKTTLVEALLHRAGAVERRGTVEAGTTVCDSDPESIERRTTLVTSVAPLEWTAPAGGVQRMTFLDTPGHEDFHLDMDAALTVADLALVLVSAVDGVQEGTRRAWRRAHELGLPRILFVTKEDKRGADFESVLAGVRRAFGANVLPLDAPEGEEEDFTAVTAVLDSPDSEYHEEVVEEIVSADDDQLERYLDGDKITAAEIERTLAGEVADAAGFPLVVGSAEAEIGLGHLLDLLCTVGPTPATRGAGVLVDGVLTRVAPDPAGPPLLQVFKTITDQYVGQISLFKLLSGTIGGAGVDLVNSVTGATEHVAGVFRVHGSRMEPTTELCTGEIGAMARLVDTPTRSLLAPEGFPVALADLGTPAPGYGRALLPRTRTDGDKLPEALRRMVVEDPSLRYEFRAEVGQTVLLGTGDVHLQVTLDRLRRKFGVEVDTETPAVPYHETASRTAVAEGRVKKQSGGHGQFAVVSLTVSPGERGSGLTFVDSTVGGSIPRQYMHAVRAGCEDAMYTGGPRGHRLVDLVVEVLDGRHHSVDSSDMAFRTAADIAVREAVATGGSVLLEPMRHAVVTVPGGSQGEVLTDLATRRARITGTCVTADGEHEITAVVPMAELLEYVPRLRSITGGRGRFAVTPLPYEPVR